MGWIYLIVTFGISLWYMERIKKDETKTKGDGLVKNERYIVPLLCFLNPIFAGLSFYYGWKNAFPEKAQSANHWSLGFFLLWFVAYGFISGQIQSLM